MKNSGILLIFIVIFFQACEGQLTDFYDSKKINGVCIQDHLLRELQKTIGKDYIEFNTVKNIYTSDEAGFPETVETIGNGFYFPNIPEIKARMIFDKYYDKIKKKGNYIFLKGLDFDDDWNSYYDITIVKAEDQYEVLRIMNTAGLNYHITNEMVIEQIKKWDKEVKLKVIVAESDRVEAYINKLPDDLRVFTGEIYEFCPDVIKQGYEDIEDMIKDYKKSNYFWLWWD